MDATVSLQTAIQDVINRAILIYLLSGIVALIVQYLIIRAAVQHGTMAALLDAGLVKRQSPWAKRTASLDAQRAAREAQVLAARDELPEEESFFAQE